MTKPSRQISTHLRSTRGFTLVETLVAISVFVIVIGLATSVFTDTFATDRKTKVSRDLFEESRIALERMVKEVRRGTVDYEEYWSWHRDAASPAADTDYGRNYGQYAAKFYRNGTLTNLAKADLNRSSENVGANTSGATNYALGDASSPSYGTANCGAGKTPVAPASNGYEQCELYLITADGSEKIIFKLRPVTVPTRPAGDQTEYRLVMLHLTGSDTDADGVNDTWTPLDDYAGYTFQPIQPETINIKSLKFFVSPLEDPRKAFATFTNDIQIQPHVTIQFTAEPTFSNWAGIKGGIPSITLQTTVSARAQAEVKSLK